MRSINEREHLQVVCMSGTLYAVTDSGHSLARERVTSAQAGAVRSATFHSAQPVVTNDEPTQIAELLIDHRRNPACKRTYVTRM